MCVKEKLEIVSVPGVAPSSGGTSTQPNRSVPSKTARALRGVGGWLTPFPVWTLWRRT